MPETELGHATRLAVVEERQNRFRQDMDEMKKNLGQLENVTEKQQTVVSSILWVLATFLIILLLVAFGPLDAMRAAFGLLPTN
ncbi:hypothetical protein J9253_05935 [Thiothrix litoralis]|jgi:hypothetical protein|uniref:Uncharacterized protein n=1 Tax=Thiothrix litoralis TaxID=2891210 RepID=A0ABX7WWB6_9GAMM|nr:hypothetical protein [Thiothrix litoralis]QTR47472.1 hypothetical protein J9253_05935 [Thiothrix litoralis]